MSRLTAGSTILILCAATGSLCDNFDSESDEVERLNKLYDVVIHEYAKEKAAVEHAELRVEQTARAVC